MTNNKPSLAEWRALYQAASEFKKLTPWEWMYDSHLFGVRNPDDGSIGYCCVMGANGEHYALGVYLGNQGLAGYLAIQSHRSTAENALFVQTLLMASFENVQLVEKEDRNIIRELKLSFRGRNNWPLFRFYEPGFFPWFIDKKQAVFLTHCLAQSIQVALAFNKDPNIFEQSPKLGILVREQTPDGTWRDTRINPFPLSVQIPEPIAPLQPNDKLVEKLKKAGTSSGILEIDIFPSNSPVTDKNQRPFFPYIAMMAEHHSGFIVGFELKERRELLSGFPDLVAKHLAHSPLSCPAKILVRSDEAAKAISPLATKLGIEIELTKKLPAITAAKKGMRRFNAFNLF
jgi:hypothetical protein